MLNFWNLLSEFLYCYIWFIKLGRITIRLNLAITGALVDVFDRVVGILFPLWITRIMQSGFGHVHAVHEARKMEAIHSAGTV